MKKAKKQGGQPSDMSKGSIEETTDSLAADVEVKEEVSIYVHMQRQ